MKSSPRRTGIEPFIYEYALTQGGCTFEVSVRMNKKCVLSKRFDKIEHARRYRDMLLIQRKRLRKVA